ncbi:hypothetical protein ACB094_06G011200 [Castanea mollissima]
MAESVVSLVIENLVPLLVQKVKLLKGIHDEVESIIGELEFIRSFLKDADARAEKEDMNNVAKTCVKLVREKAYHLEDAIDKYILHFAKKSHKRRRYFHFLQKVFHFTINLKPQHVIASNIQEQGRSSNTGSVTWHDPRVASLFIKEAEVVGIESPRAKLIEWLVEGPSKCKVFSVIGIGGLGKTTLVKKVFDNEKVATHFDCHAWITVSQSYKMESLLRDTIKQLYKARKEFAPWEIETMKETSLIEELSKYLCEHRYLVVFGDLWDVEFWGHIKFAFPENERGNRIVITSRNEDVAPSTNESPNYYVYKLPPLPFEIALELFYIKVFQCEGEKCPSDFFELSRGIVERCGGLPLAIVAIGGFLSTKDKVVSEWQKLHDSLSSELENNSHLRSIPKILSLSYHDLPYNLKACFLYFGMFPEDHSINCSRLIRLWIAEGFVKERQGTTLEEVAQDYLNQLINKSLVQLTRKDFVVQNFSNCKRIARRLSIQNNVNTPLESITSSQTRSILIFGIDEMPNSFLSIFFANFKLMKVIDCESAPIDYIPKEVGNLFLLRYLSLRDTKVHILPKSIGKLHNLETLDLKRSLVSELPVEINGLQKLRYLAAYFESHDIEDNINFQRAVKIQSGIACLQSLQKLFKIEANNDALIEELGSLGQLRKLQICKLNRENGTALCTALEKMSHLQSLKISAAVEEEVLELQSMSSPPPRLQTLILCGQVEKLPEWIPKLKYIVRIGLDWSRLMDDPFKVLQALTNLMDLLLYDGYGGEQLHIEGGGFQKLKYLGLRNLGGLNMLIIDEDALPLLEILEIGPSPQLRKVPTGIQHLKSLKNLQFYEMPTEFVLSMQPAEGPEFWKVKHIPSVHFWNRIQGEHYKIHKLGDPELLELLQR